MTDLDLLRAYEPVIRFTEGELFFPVAVDDYVGACGLIERFPGDQPDALVAARGTLTLERLAEIGAARPGPGLFLRLVDQPFSRAQTARWRLRRDRPRFGGANRLARVGILSRIVDALMRLSLFFRGKVASGTQAAAETLYREQMRPGHHPYYGRVVRTGGYIAVQYWFFYAFNDWRSRVYGVNDHEADWEQVVVYLIEEADGSTTPKWVAFSAHDEVGDDLRRRWDDPDLTLIGDHPVVHAGAGSHSGAYLAGEYLTTFEPVAFRRLLRLFRGVTRLMLPWTRDSAHAGIGIPYVDYARGDGVSIGPGQDREWTPVVVDDTTPWVFEYQGLWGNDTADPLGGERGPAGPRYERSGAVRESWGDLVGWSGLAKVAPSPEIAHALIRQRLADLDHEVRSITEQVEAERTKLRADASSGVPVSREQETQVGGLTARRTELDDERRRLEARLGAPPAHAGPHDHLGRRHLPAPATSTARRRLLAIWSALSTPIILIVVGNAFLPGSTATIRAVILATVAVLLTIEAVARRQLLRFLVAVVVLLAAGSLIAAFVGLVVFQGWHVAVSVVCGVLALVLVVTNLNELRRD
jgi:hypothetical protein